MIRPAAFAFFALLLSPVTHSADAQPACPIEVSETLGLFESWRSHMQTELDVDVQSAIQGLKSVADRVGRAMEGVDGLNHFNALYWQILRDIAENENPQASMDASERLSYQVGWASSSLKSLSACLALAEVDASNAGDLSMASAAMLMRYVRPEMFPAIGALEQVLRNTEPLDQNNGRTVWRSLLVVNGFVNVSQGSFSECENLMRNALLRGTSFVVPQEYFTGVVDPAVLRLNVAAATTTLGEAATTCNLQ